jgi:hypothetical protein
MQHPRSWTPRTRDEMLSVDSGYLAVVASEHLDRLSVAYRALLAGHASISAGRWMADVPAVLCWLGQDGEFPYRAVGTDSTCTMVEVVVGSSDDEDVAWSNVAQLAVPSGSLLVLDPHWCHEYTAEPVADVVFGAGLWMEVRVNNAQPIHVDVALPETAEPWGPALGIRASAVATG